MSCSKIARRGPRGGRPSSGVIAPAEVLERVGRRVPRGEHGGSEALDVAVHVAGGRPDVVGRDDPATVLATRRRTSDDAEPRQLVVVEPDRRPAQGVEDLVEGVGVDRRRQAVPDRGGADGEPGLGAPGVRRQVVRQLGDEQDGRRRAGRVGPATRRSPRVVRRRASADRRASRARRPAAASRRSRPRRRARSPGRRAPGTSRRASRSVDLPAPCPSAATTIGTRPSISSPQRRGQLRVERAGPDQLHDGARLGRQRAEGPPTRRRGGVGHR